MGGESERRDANPSAVLRLLCGGKKWGRNIFRPYIILTIVFGYLSFGWFYHSWVQNECDKLVQTTHKYLSYVVIELL